MKRIIIAALALTLATAVQANPSDPIEAAADSLLNLIASVLPHFLWVIPAWFVASYFYNGMKHEKADRKRKEAEAFKVAVVMHRAQRFGDGARTIREPEAPAPAGITELKRLLSEKEALLSAKEAKKKADEEARLAAEEAARLKRLDDRARTEHAWQSLENIIAQATERVRQVLDGHGLPLDRGSQFYLEGGRYGSELHLKEVGKEVGTVRMWLETTSDPFKLVVGSEALNFEKITVDDLSDALSRAF